MGPLTTFFFVFGVSMTVGGVVGTLFGDDYGDMISMGVISLTFASIAKMLEG